MSTIYRNYIVAKVGDNFVAQSQEDDSFLLSKSQSRLMSAIDQLWAGLESGTSPPWFSGSSAIDLDAFDIEESTPESTPSETDPPARTIGYTTFGLSAILVAAPIAYLIHGLSIPVELDVFFTLAVCAVSVAFGREYALLLTALSAIVYNFCAVDPILWFTLPSWEEIAYILINVIAATAIPMIIKKREARRVSSA